MGEIFVYVGSTIIFLWGVGHLAATRPVVSGFGPISADNKRVITMEWIVEGMLLCFIGVLAVVLTTFAGMEAEGTVIVARGFAVLLLLLSFLSLFTGARTSVVPMKLCPVIKTAVAALFVAATFS
jgi:hypothetical protein